MMKQKVLTTLAVSIACNLCIAFFAFAQATPSSAIGSIKLAGQLNLDGEKKVLDRKRFFLLRGGLKENQALVERLKNAEILSRDCYYQSLKVSPQFMCWLKTKNYNCESPYCREISLNDINAVPEFLTAYKKGLRQFGKRREIAREWITTNLPAPMRDGFYRQQKLELKNLRAETKPIQALMTDSISGSALFIDIPLNLQGENKKETFTVSNLLPLEIGNKSYAWACEVEVGADKQITLKLPEKKTKNCEVFIKDLKDCKTGQCSEIGK